MLRFMTATVLLLLCATTASAQRRAFDLTTPLKKALAAK